MSEFNIQSESIDVERIMEQIRGRIKEKRGEDYTEEQIRELASVKLERFLDPGKVRSDLVEHYRRQHRGQGTELAFPEKLREPPPAPESFEFDPDIIYRSSRGLPGRLLYGIRKLLSPVLKFFFNPGPIVHALHVQREINERQNEAINWMVQTQAEFIDRVTKLFDLSSSRLAAREEIDALNYEVMNNLVVEMTRLSIEMKNHRMRVESVAGRLDFDERRARALEGAVQYRKGTTSTATDGTPAGGISEGAEPRRRRRRRGRRRPTRADTPQADATASGPEAPSQTSGDQPETPGETGPPAGEHTDETRLPAGAQAQPSSEAGPPPDDQTKPAAETRPPAGTQAQSSREVGPPPDDQTKPAGQTHPPAGTQAQSSGEAGPPPGEQTKPAGETDPENQ